MPSYGRGGAGNIQAVAQDKDRIAADLEANVRVDENDAIINSNEASQEYMHSGRGGAGNFYSAAEVSMGTSHEEPLPAQGTRTAGRGGAGNYGFAASTNEQEAALEIAKTNFSRKRIAQTVEKDVNEQLAMPPQAKLAQKRAPKQ